MTLTTEQLRAEMIEKIAVASGLRARDGRNVVAEAIYAEVVEPLLAANREAQPVAATPIYQIWDDDGWFDTSEQIWRATYDDFRKEQYRIVYTAPPAPKSTNAADWGINMQTGTPILTYKTCCVIESEQAYYVLSLINNAISTESDK
ncbi:hypothetical protein [Serratia nevei]|uniref:hypothetical protein n=1 Tax=Serratia nevei TaxID=2703794 RepID=UPI003F7E1ABB